MDSLIEDTRLDIDSAQAPNLQPSNVATSDVVKPDDPMKHPKRQNSKHGWTRDARKLVMLWTAQLELNRGIHQKSANAMGAQSTDLKIVAAVFGSAAAFVSFLNTTFSNNYPVNITLCIIAGLFAAVATLVGVIAALFNLDQSAEQHRQTAIQYANVCNEAQTILVEEDEEDLPHATEYLRKMKDLTHLIQMFGPSIDGDANSDLPSKFLLQNLGLTANVQVDQTAGSQNFTGIFEHGDTERKSSMADRRRVRAALVEEMRNNAAEIKKRKNEIAVEETELKTLTEQLTQNVRGGTPPTTFTASARISIDDPAPGVRIARVASSNDMPRSGLLRRYSMPYELPSMVAEPVLQQSPQQQSPQNSLHLPLRRQTYLQPHQYPQNFQQDSMRGSQQDSERQNLTRIQVTSENIAEEKPTLPNINTGGSDDDSGFSEEESEKDGSVEFLPENPLNESPVADPSAENSPKKDSPGKGSSSENAVLSRISAAKLKEEIDRRKAKIKADKAEIKRKRFVNSGIKRKIYEARSDIFQGNIVGKSPSAPANTGTNSPKSVSKTIPPAKSPLGKIKEVFIKQEVDVKQQVQQQQQDKYNALVDLCGDALN